MTEETGKIVRKQIKKQMNVNETNNKLIQQHNTQ